jgi:NAD(P)-dependent dehydrogenase (short-subunit alcohol dehydrogenase family)
MNPASEKGVVVTGAGSGIGRALAAKLAAEGARLVINDLDSESVARVAAELGAHAIAGDAASAEGSVALVEAARDHLGEIDIWFGNAGIDRGRGLQSTDQEWAQSLEVNLLGNVRAARLLVPGWVERGGGRFVVTASAAGLLTMLGNPSYSASKHAVVAFAEWLSATYRHQGVVVQAICPLGVQTPLLDNIGAERVILETDPVLTPEEVAQAVWEALSTDRFLILPHAQVEAYYRARIADTDRWLSGMNRMQQRFLGSD